MTDITRSPLCWPHQSPRTKADDRRRSQFGKKNSKGWGKIKLTLREARDRLLQELSSFTKYGHNYRCEPDTIIISSDLQVGKDGWPLAKQRKITDTGVAVYFVLDGVQRCIPCDTYLRIEDNLAAVAATIEALRTIERHGSQMFEAAFSGFDALPAPDHVMSRNWRDVLDYYGNDLFEAELQYQRKRKAAHPDHKGTDEQFIEVQSAWKKAQEELK